MTCNNWRQSRQLIARGKTIAAAVFEINGNGMTATLVTAILMWRNEQRNKRNHES